MANYYVLFSALLTLENKKELEWCKKHYDKLRAKRDREDNFDLCEFNLTFDEELNEAWFRVHESGTPDHVANFVQAYMKRFKKNNAAWAMEWSNFCDKDKLDAYGGGAVIVTAKKLYWMTTSGWADETLGKLLAANMKGKESTK